MEDRNAAHGHKSTSNLCARFRAWWHIRLLSHPSISPDMNPIEKVWRRMRNSLLKRVHQPTTRAQMQQAMLEEWDAIPQEFINRLIL